MTQLFLIRHGAPEIDPSLAPERWLLSREGEATTKEFARSIPAPPGPLFASPEPKATKTAMLLASAWGTRAYTDPDFHEVSGRRWMDSQVEYEVAGFRYLRGEEVEGWERRESALKRVTQAVERLVDEREETVVVSHGLVLVLLLASLLSVEPEMLIPAWQTMRFPDLCIVDTKRGRVLRAFGMPVGAI